MTMSALNAMKTIQSEMKTNVNNSDVPLKMNTEGEMIPRNITGEKIPRGITPILSLSTMASESDDESSNASTDRSFTQTPTHASPLFARFEGELNGETAKELRSKIIASSADKIVNVDEDLVSKREKFVSELSFGKDYRDQKLMKLINKMQGSEEKIESNDYWAHMDYDCTDELSSNNDRKVYEADMHVLYNNTSQSAHLFVQEGIVHVVQDIDVTNNTTTLHNHTTGGLTTFTGVEVGSISNVEVYEEERHYEFLMMKKMNKNKDNDITDDLWAHFDYDSRDEHMLENDSSSRMERRSVSKEKYLYREDSEINYRLRIEEAKNLNMMG